MKNRYTIKTKIILIALGLLATGTGFAQTDYYTSEFYTRGIERAYDMDRNDRYEPFHIPLHSWSLLPRMTLSYSQSDNYYLSDSNEISSATVNLVPGAMLVYGRPEHNHVYLDAGMIIPVYEKEQLLENGESYMLLLGGEYSTGKSRISTRIGHRRQERADWQVGERLLLRDYTAAIDLTHSISSKRAIGLGGDYGRYDYSQDRYIDYQRMRATARLYQEFTGRSDVYIQGGIGWDDIDRESPGERGDAEFYDVSLGLRGRVAPKITTDGSVGYRWCDYPDDDNMQSIEEYIANINIEYTPVGYTVLTLALLADIRPDVTGQGDAVLDRRVRVGINRRLFVDRLRGSASLIAGSVDYYGNTAATDESYRGYQLGLDYLLPADLSVGLGYSYTERDRGNEQPGYDYDQWSVRISWSY